MNALLAQLPPHRGLMGQDRAGRARSYFRHGLLLSSLLHVVLLAAFLRLTAGPEEALLPLYRIPTDLLPTPTIEQVPLPEVTPTRTPTSDVSGRIVPTLREIDLPTDFPDPVVGVPEGPSGPESGPTSGDPRPTPRPGSGPDVPPNGGFQVGDVDKAPVATFAPKPIYPEWEREAGIEGKVLLHVLVAADGTVTRVVIKQNVARLGEAAQEMLYRWRFTPASMHGHSVPVWVEIPVSFKQ